jgi:hypothetical protein
MCIVLHVQIPLSILRSKTHGPFFGASNFRRPDLPNREKPHGVPPITRKNTTRIIHLKVSYLHLHCPSCQYSSINFGYHNHTSGASCRFHQMHPTHMLTSTTQSMTTNSPSISTTYLGLPYFFKG